MNNTLKEINTPAYAADIAAIKRNMTVVDRIKKEAKVSIVLATKAFAMPAVFPYMRDHLDGTTASGLYEARLGAEHFGKDVHTYSPAFKEEDLREILQYSRHIYFNSVQQLERFAPLVRGAHKDAKIGLRINPGLSLVKNSELYDPSSLTSRFGIEAKDLSEDILKQIDILHFHNLCENMAEDSVALIEHISAKFGSALRKVKNVNLGGGHYITHPDYNVKKLIHALKDFQKAFDVKVTLEPGGALVYDAGYLVSEVMDIFERKDGTHHAIIDASASTHMPDVLEVPYRPNILDSGKPAKKAHTYILGGNTCMTGDVIGTYSFDEPLEIGRKLIFTDMMQYSFVKNTTFNGVPLPDLGILHEDGAYELVKSFAYENFSMRLGIKRGQ
ncbi:MAG: carboxynorspermidine decarboxylase [Alphaproteobacteria bacterium]